MTTKAGSLKSGDEHFGGMVSSWDTGADLCAPCAGKSLGTDPPKLGANACAADSHEDLRGVTRSSRSAALACAAVAQKGVEL